MEKALTALQLATKYAGFSAVESQILTALESLDIVRGAVRDTCSHLNNDSDDTALEALSAVKRYLESSRDTTRSEIAKLRHQLASGD